MKTEWQKAYGKWLRRLHFKSKWQSYIDNEITYGDFREYVFYVVNKIRELEGSPLYSREKFDNGWQWRTVAHGRYSVAYDELLNLIYGWW